LLKQNIHDMIILLVHHYINHPFVVF